MEKQSAEHMDEQFIQEVKTVSREIVEKEFPDEEEYFDFLFDLVIPELQDMEPGKEAETLKKIRDEHPSARKRTTDVISTAFQVLVRGKYSGMDTEYPDKELGIKIQEIIEDIMKDKDEQEESSGVPNTLKKNIKKAREKTEKDQE